MEVDEEGGGLGFPLWVAKFRKIEPHDPFFSAGNAERELLAKQLTLDLTEDERCQLQIIGDAEGEEVFCPIVGCSVRLRTLNDFEDHYNARHTASCSVCSRVFPTSRLLSIHVSESHDSFFQAKVARGFPMYECLVEGCGTKLKTYKSRQQHLVDKHQFPVSFQFFRKSNPSKKQRQKNMQPKDEKARKKEEMDVEVHVGEEGSMKYGEKREEMMEDLISAVSKLTTSHTSPTSISFGRRHARGFQFLPRALQHNRNPPSSKG